jgi:hypothetical protein
LPRWILSGVYVIATQLTPPSLLVAGVAPIGDTIIYLGEGIYRGDLVRLERELHKTSHGR